MSTADTMQPMSPTIRSLSAAAVALGLLACGGSQSAGSLAELDFGEDLLAPDAQAIRQAAALELLAVSPDGRNGPASLTDPSFFHGFEVLGQTTLAEPALVLELLDLIAQSCRANDTSIAACFGPRHGVSVRSGGSTVDLLICFKCLQMRVFRDGERVHSGLLASTYEPLVSKIYRSAGLSIAD
jgi:hypothetical protein